MRALLLNHNVVRTGTFQRAFGFGRELVRLGHEVTLVTTSADRRTSGREWESEGVRIIEAPDLLSGSARTGWDAWNTVWRLRRLGAERFDVLHAFDCRPAVILPALALRRRTGVPLFIDWADWWGRGGTIQERSGWLLRTFFAPVETWFEEAFRAGATGNTTIIETLRQRCIGLGVQPECVVALPNGCRPPAPEPPDRQAARRRLGVGGDHVVLHVGVAFPEDAAFLFDAFRQVRRELPGTRLVLIGRFAHAIPTDLRDAVHRTGFVDEADLDLWLAAADVGLLVLRDTIASRGRWPGKLSDYLTGGVPIVLPRVGPAAELIAAAGAAVSSDPAPHALAERTVAVLRDEQQRRIMSDRARALAAGELSWPSVTERLIAFYEQCGVQACSSATPRVAARVS